MTMTAQTVQPSRSGIGPGGWAHFGVAAGVLLVAAGAWFAVLPGLLSKRPVPPPEGTELNKHLLCNFPGRLGPYVLAPEAEANESGSGDKDGIHEQEEDLLQTLGTLKHKWNWYYMATYRDTRAPMGARYVRLEITYYTGLVDAVPHVGERCIVAGGGEIIRHECGPIKLVADALEPPWNDIEVYRTTYRRDKSGDASKSAQYHFFSSNGLPRWRWETVRWEMGNLFKKYQYFAKIQLTARGAQVKNLAVSDEYCLDFLAHALPAVLKFLPAAADVEKLEASGD